MLQRTTYTPPLGASRSAISTADVLKAAGLIVLAALAVLAFASAKVETAADPEAIAALYGP